MSTWGPVREMDYNTSAFVRMDLLGLDVKVFENTFNSFSFRFSYCSSYIICQDKFQAHDLVTKNTQIW